MPELETSQELLQTPNNRETLLHDMRQSEIWEVPFTAPDKHKPPLRDLAPEELKNILGEIQKGLGKYNTWLEWGKGEKIVTQILFGSLNNGQIREDEQGNVISDADILTIVEGKRGGQYPRPGGMGGEGAHLQFTKTVHELNMEIISQPALQEIWEEINEMTQEYYLDDYLDQVYTNRPKHIFTLKNRWYHLQKPLLHLHILTFGTTLSQKEVPVEVLQQAWKATKKLEEYKRILEWQSDHPGKLWNQR